MNSVRFIVTGIEEIDRKLSQLEPALGKKVIRQAMRGAMKLVKEATIRAAPKPPARGRHGSKRTGMLAKSVKIKAAKRSTLGLGVDVTIGEGDFKGDTYYAAMVEYGTKLQPAQHYMKEAYELTKDAAYDVAVNRITAGLVKEIESK